jgi:carbon starvation protein
MSVIYFAIIGLIVAFISYVVMGRWVERNMAKPVGEAETPACKLNDGANFRPQNKWILLGYHWAAICGPAPIIGAVLVMVFGWLPALIWFCLGILFLGAMHDYMANMVSVRGGAASIAGLAGRLLTKPAKVMFAIIAWFVCILVIGSFSIIFGRVLASMPEQVPIVVYFTIIAYLVGLLMYRTKIPLGWTVLIGCIAYGVAVWLGVLWPWKGPYAVMFWLIIAYAFVVSIIPVAHIETPRGALNAVLMGVGVLVIYVGVFALGIASPEAAAVKLPMWGGSFFKVPGPGPLWPMVPGKLNCDRPPIGQRM